MPERFIAGRRDRNWAMCFDTLEDAEEWIGIQVELDPASVTLGVYYVEPVTLLLRGQCP